jgi:DNA-binding winged helix-turn-helix (wHTH) protein
MQETSKEVQRQYGAYRFSRFTMHPSDRLLLEDGRTIPIPPKAFDALVHLVSRAEHLVRKDELMDTLWPGAYVSEANLTNLIVSLRKILGQQAIRTVSKHGYRFELPVEGAPGVKEAAYVAFVRAKELSRVPSVDSMLRARELFWLSVAEDPAFAPAWAWLGRCCRFLEKFGVDTFVNLDLAKAAFRQAFTLDPDLASAHHFFTPLEADSGHSQEATLRLLKRMSKGGREPEFFAGLVQVLRFRGLLHESLSAHQHTVSLDPTVATSVAHTHFLMGAYESVIETYGGRGNYLDAAALAALGETTRAIDLLQKRASNAQLSQLFRGSIKSLLAILQDQPQQAMDEMLRTSVERDPEIVFYFARQFSKLNEPELAIRWLHRAQAEGFFCSRTLREDPWFAPVRAAREYQRILEEIERAEEISRRLFSQAGGEELLS